MNVPPLLHRAQELRITRLWTHVLLSRLFPIRPEAPIHSAPKPCSKTETRTEAQSWGPGESRLKSHFLNNQLAMECAHTHRTCCAFDFTAWWGSEEIDLLSRHIMSSDPDRSISFQLSDMFSIVNKPSGATAPWSSGTEEAGEEPRRITPAKPPSSPSLSSC